MVSRCNTWVRCNSAPGKKCRRRERRCKTISLLLRTSQAEVLQLQLSISCFQALTLYFFPCSMFSTAPPPPLFPFPSRRYHCSCEPQAVAEKFPTLKLKRFSFFPEKVSAFFPVFFSGMINFGKVSGLFPEYCLGMELFVLIVENL